MRKPTKLLFMLLMLSLSGCANQCLKDHPEPAVKNHQSNAVEYSLPNRDPGDYQSPINIFTFNTKKQPTEHQFIIHYQDKISTVENLGHTIQLDFKAGSTITSDGHTYVLKQMHFHTPAEHLIDGVTFPMELHIVSVDEENPATPHYLVIGILFKMGKANPFIDEFLTIIPHNAESETPVKSNSIQLKNLLSTGDLTHHYHYKGSLTTPPYTETVNWFVLKKNFEASPEQIKAMNAIEGNNARHIEPKNNRVVEDN